MSQRDAADESLQEQHAGADAAEAEAPSGLGGVGLLVAAYTRERAADDTLTDLMRVGSTAGLLYDDAAVVRRDAEGRVHVTETGDMSTRTGAGVGALIGGIIGILGGPAGIAIGAGAGAALGGLAAHADIGFDQQSLEQLGAALPPGASALVVTTSQDFVESVRDQVTDADTMTTAAQIAAVVGDHLAARQDVLLAMALTTGGVTASKIVSAPDQLAVFHIAVRTATGTGLGSTNRAPRVVDR